MVHFNVKISESHQLSTNKKQSEKAVETPNRSGSKAAKESDKKDLPEGSTKSRRDQWRMGSCFQGANLELNQGTSSTLRVGASAAICLAGI